MKYQIITDVIEYEVKPALGEWVRNFDDDALRCIAEECFEYREGEFKERYGVDFWAIVEKYDIHVDD